MAKKTNNEKAFDAFFKVLNGKVYTTPEQMKDDYVAALTDNGFVVKRKMTYISRKKKTVKQWKKIF